MKVDSKLIFYFSLALIGLLKLILISDRDILAINSAHDEFWYIHNAYNLFSRVNYDNLSLAHLPTYSIFLKLLASIGIQIRMGVELIWILSAYFLANQIRIKQEFRVITAISIYIFLLFHPYVIFLFDRALTENLLTILTLLCSGLFLSIINDSHIKRYKVYIFAFLYGIAYYTRSEGIVILLPLIGVISYYSLKKIENKEYVLKNKIFLLISIYSCISIIFCGLTLCTYNKIKWNSFVVDELKSTEYKSVMKSLISIDAGPTPLQTSVTFKMLELGYQTSPTLRELKPFLEGKPGQDWLNISKSVTGVNEIADGWFYWALRDAAAAAGWFESPKTINEKFKAISNEIEKGFKDKVIKKRNNVFLPFIDPDYKKWMINLPSVFKDLVKLILIPNSNYIENRVEDADEKQFNEYTKITGRRNLLPSLNIAGWIYPSEYKYTQLYANEVRLLQEENDPNERPDVLGAHSFQIGVKSGSQLPNKICFQSDKNQICTKIEDLKQGQVHKIEASPNEGILGVDKFYVVKRARILDKYTETLCFAYRYISILLILSTLITLIKRYFHGKKISINYLGIIFISSYIFSRLVLLSVLGSSSWSAMQPRYLMPLIPILALLMFQVFQYKNIRDE